MSARANRNDRKRQTRDELVAAAERLLAARTLDVVPVDEITRVAGVSKGTFYTHFADKSDLAAAITHRSREDLEEKISAQNDSLTDAAVRLANGLAATFNLAIVDPVRARARLRLQPLDPDAPLNDGLRGDLVMGFKSKRFNAPSETAAVLTVIGGVLAAVSRLSDTEHRVPDPYALAGEVIATLLVSLGLNDDEAIRLANAAVTARCAAGERDRNTA